MELMDVSITLLRSKFVEWMNGYADAYNEVVASQNFKHPFRQIVSNEIPDLLRSVGKINSPYIVVGSYGKGRWTAVPWIAIFDSRITTSAQRGVYIVYLLNKDTKELYLTFAIAATEALYSSNSGVGKSTPFVGLAGHIAGRAATILSQKAEEIRVAINDNYFNQDAAIDTGSQGYDSGAVYYKKYSIDKMPAVESLLDDLKRMLSIYHKYYVWKYENESDDKWLPSLSDYNPGITKEQWLSLLNDSSVFTEEHLLGFACIYDNGGQGSCSELATKYKQSMVLWRTSIAVHLSKKVAEKTHCPIQIENGNNVYYSIPFLYRLTTKEETGSCMYKVRPELMEALKEFDIERYLPEVSHSWRILSDTVAVKQCDKSFFKYHGSAVPREIWKFFQAQNMTSGTNLPIRYKFDGKLYDGRVEMDKQSPSRVRIFWPTELGKRFALFSELTDPVAKFTKVAEDTYEITISEGEPEMIVDEPTMTDKEIVEHIKDYIAGQGLTYPEGMLENFYLSLKSKPFVILAGTSGTGKSKLVETFAEAIGATSENGQYKLIPVRPDWSDSSDLFGHIDLQEKFHAGAVLEFINQAAKPENKDKPYILCLDEMNLARVEYYLSDFLSVMETRKMNDDGEITSDPLVRKELFGDTIPEGYGELQYPDNLYVVGTVNMDETTFPFSKKVLDRANTVEFGFVNLKDWYTDEKEDVKPVSVRNGFLRSEWLKIKQCRGTENEYIDSLCQKLADINDILKDCDAHVGFRVRDEIVFYMLNNKRNGMLLEEDEALDYEILQKILPRIQGSSVAIKNMLIALYKYCRNGKTVNDNIELTAKEMKDGSAKAVYKKSAEKISFMMKRYEEDGFTSYWL